MTRILDFKGKSNRVQYWNYVIFSFLLMLLSYGIGGKIGFAIVYIYIFIAGLALSIRRLNDLQYSRYWVFLMFIPVLNLILLLVFLFFKSKTQNP